MAGMTEWLALGVTFLGIVLSSVLAYLVYASGRQSQRAEAARAIGNLYDKMMDFRAQHPNVLALSRTWSVECFARIYHQDEARDYEWTYYYTYVELCCGFVNAVLDSYECGLLRHSSYRKHYRPLVRLILTEHYPYLLSANQEKYLSRYIGEFLRKEAEQGWEWAEMHRVLPGPPELPLPVSSRQTT